MPQSGIVMDILRVKYAQIFQKYIEQCFIRLKGSLCYRRSYTRYLFIFKNEIELHDTTHLKE